MSGVLYNDALLFNFMEFVEEQEGAGCDRDMLEFWLAASNFRERSTAEHVQEDALIIYQRFISLEATSPLGKSDNKAESPGQAISNRKVIVVVSIFCVLYRTYYMLIIQYSSIRYKLGCVIPRPGSLLSRTASSCNLVFTF